LSGIGTDSSLQEYDAIDVFRHPDLDRPAISLAQLQAMASMIKRHLPDDVALRELEVLPASTLTPAPAPLEGRATVVEPPHGSSRSGLGRELGAEIRAEWPSTDFQFSIHVVHDETAGEA
jgi:hypothetical protein